MLFSPDALSFAFAIERTRTTNRIAKAPAPNTRLQTDRASYPSLLQRGG
jgi:hypothetical protein